MTMTPDRRVRRAPLGERIQAYLNPWDFLLWLSEEINSNEWEDTCTRWATPAGVAINVVFMFARANVRGSSSARSDDVFGDHHERLGSGWLAWLASFLVHFLTLFSCVNAAYTFLRRRHYRLFEANVERDPGTPSAKRVRVDSSPMTSSPRRYWSYMMDMAKAESRSYPDSSRDVWEIAVWDPTPLCLRLFCLFSPGHVLVYWLFLPLAPLDPRPSTTIVTTMALVTLFSTLLIMLQNFFTQQAKDSALINREVAHEYDAKFVHPTLNKPVRDVGTQMIPSKYAHHIPEVQTYTPTTYVNRGFQVSPNVNYSKHFDPDGLAQQSSRLRRSITTPSLHSSNVAAGNDFVSPFRPTPTPAMRAPIMRPVTANSSTGDGGSFGVYSHARSPLRKQASTNVLRDRSPSKREGSPLKQSSFLNQVNGDTPVRRRETDGFRVKRHHRVTE